MTQHRIRVCQSMLYLMLELVKVFSIEAIVALRTYVASRLRRETSDWCFTSAYAHVSWNVTAVVVIRDNFALKILLAISSLLVPDFSGTCGGCCHILEIFRTSCS